MEGILLIVLIIIVVVIYKNKKNSTKMEEKSADRNAVLLAEQFVTAFNNHEGIEKLNELSEDIIELATFYYAKYDFASYMCLLNAAKETSYMYQGERYPHDLVEDIIRERHK